MCIRDRRRIERDLMSARFSVVLAASSVLAAVAGQASAQCPNGRWLSGAGITGPSGRVLALTMWDPDGPGPQPSQLIAAGEFLSCGTTTVNRIARWDGTSWFALGAGVNGTIEALT